MSDILDVRSDIIRCRCESPMAKWWYRGRDYSIDAEYTDFSINPLKQICILNADKSVEFYSPDGCLLMHYDIAERSMYGASHRLAFDEGIRFPFSMNDKLHWFSGGRLYSASFLPDRIKIAGHGEYMALSSYTDVSRQDVSVILCRPNGGVIARYANGTLTVGGKPASDNVLSIVPLWQYDLIAALCDTEGSGYADAVMALDFNGERLSVITAAEQGYSCIYCLDAQGLSCPCIGFLKERPQDIDYRHSSGFNITSRNIDPSWYDVLYNGKEITLKYAYGMTEIFYHYNVVESR